MTAEISAVLVAHDEGPRSGVSLRSLLDAAAAARHAGLTVEPVVVLADATPGTREALAEAAHHGARVETIGAGDPGTARNFAVATGGGRHVALLDAGALWSENWLVAAHAVAASDPDRTLVHPEIHWFYEQGRELYFPPDQADPAFDPAALRLGNCWDAQAFGAVAAMRAVPFAKHSADLDWSWSRATVEAGLQHRVAAGTLNFRRRRPRSLR